MRVTRDELGDLIQDRLTGFIFAFDKMLVRHRKSWTDLAAIVGIPQRRTDHQRIWAPRAVAMTPTQPA